MKRLTKIVSYLLLLILGVVGTRSESIVGDRPFLSFTNEDSNIGVELGFSIPLLKVPLEGVKRPEEGGHILSAPIEVNIPALAVAATMFVASAAFVPKVFQILLPFLRPPVTTEEYWRRDNTSTILEHWKSILNLDNNPDSNDIPEALLGFPVTSPRPRSTSRKLAKRFLKPHRSQTSCGTFCNATNTALPLPKNVPKTDIDPK